LFWAADTEFADIGWVFCGKDREKPMPVKLRHRTAFLGEVLVWRLTEAV
jgi:hypothetical protein